MAIAGQANPANSENSTLLSGCIAEYLDHVEANFSTKTLEIYGLALRTFLAFAGDVSVGSVKAHTIDRFKIHRVKTVSIATVNLQLRAIRAFFNCLKCWDVIIANPCDSVRQIRGDELPPVFLSVKELQHLLQALNGHWLHPEFLGCSALTVGKNRLFIQKKIKELLSSKAAQTGRLKKGSVLTFTQYIE